MKVFSFLAAAVAAASLLGGAAGSSVAKGEDETKSDASKTATPKGGKDPVAAAFALPTGVVLTPKQQIRYDALKAAKEDELRDAIDDLQHSKTGASTTQAAKKVKECRAKIRAAIQEILARPNSDGSTTPGSESGSRGDSTYGGYYPAYGGYGGYAPYPYGGYPPYPPYGYPYRRPYSSSYDKQGGTSGASSGGTKGKAGGTATSGKPSPTPPPRPAPKPAPKSTR